MKFSVGLQNKNDGFLDCITENREHISEVYFSWGDFANGRNRQTESETCLPHELQMWQISALGRLSQAGIPLNLLFNANCYGKDSQSRAFFNKIGNTVEHILRNYLLNSITTTSPLIAKFIKNNFSSLSVRASVNMEIGSIQGMSYIAEYFDGYYMRREYNRDFEKIKELKTWCDCNGKKLYMLANSGCLNYCSAHNFHDNLVAHESEIAAMDNAYNFAGVCKDYLKNEKNLVSLINDTNFVRPEDIFRYEEYFDSAKLATRVHKTPSVVLSSYIRGKYSGDILRLLEPAHSIYPFVIENGEPLRLKRIDKEENI